MEWFYSVEFYVVAVTCAILLVGMIFNPPIPARAFTYIYQAIVAFRDTYHSDEEKDEPQVLTISSTPEGKVNVYHKAVLLPSDAAVNLVLDIQGDKVKIIEKLASGSSSGEMRLADIECQLGCLKSEKYHIRYECEYSGMWTTITFINSDNSVSRGIMKY